VAQRAITDAVARNASGARSSERRVDLFSARHPSARRRSPQFQTKHDMPHQASLYSAVISAGRIGSSRGEGNMKKVVTKIMVSSALLATLVAADTAYAQTPYGRESPEVYKDGAPATANDSWESGVAGKRVRVQPNDAIEDGRVVGEDPDPNIRSQLQREYHEGGDGD
jgi:hypothetical protein